jgi:2-polyprenyl-3-methyl-5-hydroxy-6-metoxy-1,4-benzoquinol methylase
MRIKTLIKAILPKPILDRINIARAKGKNARFENMTVQEVFSEIYQSGLWGRSEDPTQPYFSGSGAHDKSIAPVYVQKVCDFIQSLQTKPDVVDLGCGDFSIGSQIRPMCGSYIACDIVPKLIEFNRKKYSSLGVDFRVLDLITDELPNADVVFIRQVLQHLSNQQVSQLIPKLKPAFKYLILTEHLPKSKNFTPNLDKPNGPDIRLGVDSGLVLTQPPFNLSVKSERILCELDEYGGVIRTTIYEL